MGWFGSGIARSAHRGLEVSLLATVDVEEGGAYPLCARRSPGSVRSRRRTCGVANGGYGTRTFVEGVRALGLHVVGRLRKDAVLRFRYTGPSRGDRATRGSSTVASTAEPGAHGPHNPEEGEGQPVPRQTAQLNTSQDFI